MGRFLVRQNVKRKISEESAMNGNWIVGHVFPRMRFERFFVIDLPLARVCLVQKIALFLVALQSPTVAASLVLYKNYTSNKIQPTFSIISCQTLSCFLSGKVIP